MTSRRRIFDDDHEAFRASVKRFLATDVAPHLDGWRRDGALPRGVVAAAGAAGFLGTAVPEEFGGGGADDLGFLAVLVEETVAVGATGLALLCALHSGVVIPYLLDHGTQADRQRWLPGLSSGALIGVPAPATLSAVPGAAIADLLLVADGGEPITLIPLDDPDVRMTPVAGSLAGRDAALGDVALQGAGAHPCLSGGAAVRRDLDLWVSVLALAGARTALQSALDYVHTRAVFGRPLAEFENTRFRLAELWAELATVTGFVDSCVHARAQNAADAPDAATARLTASRLCDRAVDQSLQLHGGYGYMREYPISHAFADTRFLKTTAAAYSDPRQVLASGVGL